MKALAILTALTLVSCETFPKVNFAIDTPYGSATGSKSGLTEIILKPIIIPDRHSK